jgi:hypothetical protein
MSINVFLSVRLAWLSMVKARLTQKNCLTDFCGSDIRALRGIDLLLFGANPILKYYRIENKPG